MEWPADDWWKSKFDDYLKLVDRVVKIN
jgi:hypothetical protein